MDVEHLIGEIKSLVTSNTQTDSVSFKPKMEKPNRSKKFNWKTKGVTSFQDKNAAFSKL